MHVHFVVMGLLAVAIAIGLLYRLACALYFLSFAYVFLLDQAQYLNHYYLVLILCLLMVFLPAHRLLSAMNEAKIVALDDASRDLPRGEIGELMYRVDRRLRLEAKDLFPGSRRRLQLLHRQHDMVYS